MSALARGADTHEIINPVIPSRPWYAWMMPLIGKTIRAISRLLRHGGSALPGKIVEQLDPGFLARTLGDLPYGVVLISGTNGKTTTTRMVTSMLKEAGLRVFTNPTGSNFTRGIVAALTQAMPLFGTLQADIAVLELDEAYAVHFVHQLNPRYALLLNVMRDQLDRFGEIDTTAQLLSNVARATTRTVVLNREDSRIAALSEVTRPECAVRYFGLSQEVRAMFPTDDDLHHSNPQHQQPQIASNLPADVVLAHVEHRNADFIIGNRRVSTIVQLEGAYNMLNAAAAATMVRAITADIDALVWDDDAIIRSISHVTPAFGRGEVIVVNGIPVELVLVKNPIGFRLALASHPQSCDTMIAICDEYADGRDMSWLWDVDFQVLRARNVAMVSGTRAWDMALRLGYDQVNVNDVQPDLEQAVVSFATQLPAPIASSDGAQVATKRIYCTYTAMLRARTALSHIAHVDDAGVGR